MCKEIEAQSELIRTRRKRMNLFLYFQLASALTGLGISLSVRKSKILLAINIVVLSLVLIGKIGANQLRPLYIGIHALTTSSVLGGFFIYQIIEAIMLSENTGDQMILHLYSIPYLLDFIAGIFSLLLLTAIWDFYEVKEVPQVSLPLLQGDTCVICMDREKAILLYPCGHKCLCRECSSQYNKNRSLCPICRTLVQDMIQVYST